MTNIGQLWPLMGTPGPQGPAGATPARKDQLGRPARKDRRGADSTVPGPQGPKPGRPARRDLSAGAQGPQGPPRGADSGSRTGSGRGGRARKVLKGADSTVSGPQGSRRGDRLTGTRRGAGTGRVPGSDPEPERPGAARHACQHRDLPQDDLRMAAPTLQTNAGDFTVFTTTASVLTASGTKPTTTAVGDLLIAFVALSRPRPPVPRRSSRTAVPGP